MHDTLEEFFNKTSRSRDAIEHYLRFRSLEADQFALIIPQREMWLEKSEEFSGSLQYLLKLGLSPSILLSPARYSPQELEDFQKSLKPLDEENQPKVNWIIDKSEGDFEASIVASVQSGRYHKIIYVTDHTLTDKSGKSLDRVFLYRNDSFSEASQSDLNWMRRVLERLGPTAAIQAVEPQNLLNELFTSKGCGSMVSLGYRFAHLKSNDIDRAKLETLLEAGFARQLKGDYFDKLDEKPWSAMIEEDYRAAIVIIEHENFNYLDKVVVEADSLGRGLGSLLLEEVLLKIRELGKGAARVGWRARIDNPFLSRYASILHQEAKHHPFECGTHCDGEYVYHCIGMKLDQQQKVVEIMKDTPESFKK